MSKVRTAGDGMESDDNQPESKRLDVDGKRKDSLLPGRLVQIYPSTVIKNEKRKSINIKPPKFVPYEPYAAAVKPITSQVLPKGAKKSRNNMDINTLISQMSQMNTNLNEFKPRSKLNSTSDKSVADSDKNSQNAELQKKIDDLSKENDSLKDQLKQQVQVQLIKVNFPEQMYFY